MATAQSVIGKPTGVPAAIAWSWNAGGEFDGGVLVEGASYTPVVALMLKGGAREGWERPVVLRLELPGGGGPAPASVDPREIPVDSYLDFSFPSFVAGGPGKVKLTASTKQKGNLNSALLVAGEKAKLRKARLEVPLSIDWSWELAGELDSEDLEKGTTYGLALPAMLAGDSRRGWENPLTLELHLSDEYRESPPPPALLAAQCIPLGEYADVPFPEFVNQGVGKVTLKAATAQTGNLPSLLAVADEQIKIKKFYEHAPVGILYTWTAVGEVVDVGCLDETTTYTAELPLMLKGSGRDGWKNPVILKVAVDGGGESPPPETVEAGKIPLGGSGSAFSFPAFACKSGSTGRIRLIAETTQDANLMSALVVAGGCASISFGQGKLPVPMSFTSTWKAAGELDCAAGVQAGATCAIALPLMSSGGFWGSPLTLTLELPGGDVEFRQLPSQLIPLGEYRDFFFPDFVNQGVGKVKFAATAGAHSSNDGSSLVVAGEKAKFKKPYGEVELSVGWEWKGSGEFETEAVDTGGEIVVAVPVMLNADSYEGFDGAVTFRLERMIVRRRSCRKPAEIIAEESSQVAVESIPLRQFKVFSFPAFVCQGVEKVAIAITTAQKANAMGAVVVDFGNAMINEVKHPIRPAAISCAWAATAELDLGELRRGSTYEVGLPLMLSGSSYEGWKNPLKLTVESVADGELVVPPSMVFPVSIPLGRYLSFSFPNFPARGAGKVRLAATTAQEAILASPLIIARKRANITEL